MKELTEKAKADKVEADNIEHFRACETRANATLGRLKAEVTLVQEWSSKGKDTSCAPQTPYLDRIKILCDEIPISRPRYLNSLNLYSQRNKAVHTTLPQFQDHRAKDGSIFWSQVKAECDKAKNAAVMLQKEEGISKSQLHVITDSIDGWLSCFVSGWEPNGSPKLTAHGRNEDCEGRKKPSLENTEKTAEEKEKAERKKKKKARRAERISSSDASSVAVKPPSFLEATFKDVAINVPVSTDSKIYAIPASPYSEGKWDDLYVFSWI